MPIPQDPSLDETVALFLTAGYRYTSKRCRQLESDILETRVMSYEVPSQHLSIDLARIPALPESRLRMTRVRLREAGVRRAS